MKHSNQEQTSKNRGTADQHKKTNKPQQGEHSTAGNSGSPTSKGTGDSHREQEGEGSNWQKGKQGNRK